MNKLIYVFDPLCGWCYGFANVMSELHNKYKDRYEFDVVSGGMVRGDSIAPMAKKHDYIKGAYPRLEQMTGAKFGAAYLEQLLPSTTILMDSHMPSYALEAVRMQDDAQLIPFAHAMQKVHYMDGMDYNKVENYLPLVSNLSLDAAQFEVQIASEEVKYAAEQNFAWCANIGVQSYPTLIMQTEKGLYLVAQGYRSLADIELVLASIEKEVA
jgi:putative protein-disulfide isomerase